LGVCEVCIGIGCGGGDEGCICAESVDEFGDFEGVFLVYMYFFGVVGLSVGFVLVFYLIDGDQLVEWFNVLFSGWMI